MSVTAPGGARGADGVRAAPAPVVEDGLVIGAENHRRWVEAEDRAEALRRAGRAADDPELQALLRFAARYRAARERAVEAFVAAAGQG